MSYPSISIIIPSFNQGRFIERTLLSILNQDYSGDVQIIVSDGGSTDETVAVLTKYPQVRWWSEKDHGIADATNKGLSVATGEFLAIQSSDDFYLRDAFRHTAEHLEAHSDLAIASGCDIYLQPDEVTFTCSKLDDHEVDPRGLLMQRVFPQHCTFFRRKLMEKVGFLRTELAEGAEIDFWYRALHFVRGGVFPRHTAAYQLHPQQRTQTGRRWYRSLTRIVEDAEADEKYGSIFRLGDEDRFNLYARWQIQCAAMSGREGDLKWLMEFVGRDDRFTGETRQWLALHGFLPKPPRRVSARLHPNHAVPDLGWWMARGESALAA